MFDVNSSKCSKQEQSKVNPRENMSSKAHMANMFSLESRALRLFSKPSEEVLNLILARTPQSHGVLWTCVPSLEFTTCLVLLK